MVGSESSMLVIALGTATVASAAVWRQTARRRRIAHIEQQLDSSEASARIEAGEQVVQYGLGAAARTLLPRVEHEEHAAVRAAIALAVAYRQWEPGGSKRVLALRTWASDELATQGYDVNPFGPAFTRISDMGGPQRPPYVPPAACEPTAEPSTDQSVPTNPRVPTP